MTHLGSHSSLGSAWESWRNVLAVSVVPQRRWVYLGMMIPLMSSEDLLFSLFSSSINGPCSKSSTQSLKTISLEWGSEQWPRGRNYKKKKGSKRACNAFLWEIIYPWALMWNKVGFIQVYPLVLCLIFYLWLSYWVRWYEKKIKKFFPHAVFSHWPLEIPNRERKIWEQVLFFLFYFLALQG